MSAQDDVEQFAALLRELKERTDRSYGSLARRLSMNTSTLHRYCAGEAVPVDFAPVERFAALCGASAQERLELHRRWLLAVAARQRPRAADAPDSPVPAAAGGSASSQRAPDAMDSHAGSSDGVTGAMDSHAGSTDGATGAMDSHAGSTDGATGAVSSQGEPALPRPWYRRRRVLVAVAAAGALLATLGTLSALPDGRRPSADPARAAGPSVSAGTASKSPHDQRPSKPPASDSPTPDRPSPSTAPKKKTPPPPASSAHRTPPTGSEPVGAPLTWTANSQVWAQGCDHDYVIDKPPTQVPPPPAAQDAGPWAATQSALHGRETNVQISVQGRSSTAVVLEALRVRVVARAAPARGNAYAMDQGCGGALTPRYFAVNLDADRPVAHSLPGGDSEGPIPAVQLPYRVSAEDPEVLLVTARTKTCDCHWYLELDWSSQGRTGTVRIDDHGRPFRTSGIEGLPRYEYDTSIRRWQPYT